MPYTIPDSLIPKVRSLPKDIREEMDRVMKVFMKNPHKNVLDLEEFVIWGISYLATDIDGYRVLFRHSPDTDEIQLHGIGKIK